MHTSVTSHLVSVTHMISLANQQSELKRSCTFEVVTPLAKKLFLVH